MALFLHDVDGKTAVLALKIHILDTAVLKIGGSLHAEAEAIFLQLDVYKRQGLPSNERKALQNGH